MSASPLPWRLSDAHGLCVFDANDNIVADLQPNRDWNHTVAPEVLQANAAAIVAAANRPALFQSGDFTVVHDRPLTWKIECDAISQDEWAGLAAIAAEVIDLGSFSTVLGVPRGGLPWAEALRPYCTGAGDRILVAEDVWMTGVSINKFVQDQGYPEFAWAGLVAFARVPITQHNVTALFTMTNGPNQ